MIDAAAQYLRGYRQTPIYVNLDELVRAGRDVSDLASRRCIVKTHYPQVDLGQMHADAVESVLTTAVVVQVKRDRSMMAQSLENFFEGEPVDELLQRVTLHREFWRQRSHVSTDLPQLLNADGLAAVLDDLSAFTGAPRHGSVRAQPPLNARARILTRMALTRALGHRAPCISTVHGIRFSGR